MHPNLSAEDVRRMAAALPDSIERKHWGASSFRVGGRIFATMPDPDHVNVMIDPMDVEAVVAHEPGCEELCWGREVRGVRLTLAAAQASTLAALLEAAWRRRAPGKATQR